MTTLASVNLEAPPDEPVFHWRRFFKAPPELVYEAWTTCKHLRNWWGPRYLELVTCEIDLRVGGAYRFVSRAPDGQEHGFHGEFLELEPARRVGWTFIYEGTPDQTAVDTSVFEPVDGGTMVSGTMRFESVKDRDGHLVGGMETGFTESCSRLDELLASLAENQL